MLIACIKKGKTALYWAEFSGNLEAVMAVRKGIARLEAAAAVQVAREDKRVRMAALVAQNSMLTNEMAKAVEIGDVSRVSMMQFYYCFTGSLCINMCIYLPCFMCILVVCLDCSELWATAL